MCMMKITNNTLEKLMTHVLIMIQIMQMKTLQIKNYNLNIKCVIVLTKKIQMSLPLFDTICTIFSHNLDEE
jgi:hypothetical protein